MSVELAVGDRVAGLLNRLPRQIREPERPELRLESGSLTVAETVAEVVVALRQAGVLRAR